MNTEKHTLKYHKAKDLADQLAHMPESPDEPEDVEQYPPAELYEWLAEWGYSYAEQSWAYEGAI